MKARRYGWPLWVCLRSARQAIREGEDQSPIELLVAGRPLSVCLDGKSALHEFLCRFLRRRAVLAVDFSTILRELRPRYRTRIHLAFEYPNGQVAIGYVEAVEDLVYAPINLRDERDERKVRRIQHAVKARDRMLAMKKNFDLHGQHREQLILLTEAKAL